ncbi:MAG: hypothetical protein KatS3mg020_0484 [Fimbriimonadales bacterium]|nr:MAG: hypothetical protein KatS3mg020_0484 [Fimbriimonadales bacterium]
MFGKMLKLVMSNLTLPCSFAWGGRFYGVATFQQIAYRLTFILLSAISTLSPLQAQISFRVGIGHNRLALLNAVSDSYGHFDTPSATNPQSIDLARRCGGYIQICTFTIPPFPHHGIIMWINDDSGWQPEGWQRIRVPNGRGEQVNTVNIDGRAFRVYLLPYSPEHSWAPSQKFVFVPYPDRSVWEQQVKAERDLIIYIDEYGYYWQLCRKDGQFHSSGNECKICCNDQQSCWVPREDWDGTPDLTGNFGPPHLCGWFGFRELIVDNQVVCQAEWVWSCSSQRLSGARRLFHGTVTTVPIYREIVSSADAAVDNRPVCPNPEQPPTYAKFGAYTYLGGLFVGQVPWEYGGRGQTAPDLSGTGRTLLRFYNPDGFPTQVTAACLSLVYTATPNGVAQSSPQTKAIGVRALPQADWQETEVSWRYMETNHLNLPFGQEQDQGWIGTTRGLGDMNNPIRPRDEDDPVDSNGNLQIVAEQDWKRTPIKRVVIPLGGLNVLGQQREYVALLLALHPEAPFRQNSPSQPTWYYFLGKEHPWTDERTCPRLWYVVRQQP